MKLEKYIVDGWEAMLEDAKKNIKSDCPLLDDAVIIDMDIYIKYLEQRVLSAEKCTNN